MDKPAKAAKPARTRTPAVRKTTPRKRTATPKQKPTQAVEPLPVPPPAVAVKTTRPDLRAIAAFGFVLATAVAALLLVGQRDDARPQDPSAAAAVSAAELASFAGSQAEPVYWAGHLPARTLELTRTAAGTFVRYLPAGSAVGGSSRALTVATYPMHDAYATVARRAKETGTTSRSTPDKGLAVWSEAQPTSVYVAFPGVPALVEIYAPAAKESRTIALSGRVRPVR